MMCQVILPLWATPPKHGAAIAATVLGDPELRRRWLVELRGLADTTRARRQTLYDALQAAGAPGSWQHIVEQQGMFSMSGLTEVGG